MKAHDSLTQQRPTMHLPSLFIGVLLMLLITVWPPLLTDSEAKADHTLAMLLCMAMAAGFIRGVGFIPRWWGWRWLFSGWACILFLLLGLARKLW